MKDKKVQIRILIFGFVLAAIFQIQVYSQTLLDPNAKVEQIVTGIQQPEGPVWSDSLGLLFSDIRGNKILVREDRLMM